ncbi:uncharacterized protein encoded by LINC01551-like [Pteropus medius]|uniref:uncharacterized protein encoded by LINC01551-like n=1 Tax=Pteropus vampyrus TaxID=132908 RepID=UPI00196A48E5|nr:uncharacterized protein encoded by LINC01551-like [Pteropus giganteus]
MDSQVVVFNLGKTTGRKGRCRIELIHFRRSPFPIRPNSTLQHHPHLALYQNLRDFSLVSTMKVDGMIVHLASKYNYSSVCCYQSEVSKYEFSNSMKSSWFQADKHLGTP